MNQNTETKNKNLSDWYLKHELSYEQRQKLIADKLTRAKEQSDAMKKVYKLG